MVYTGQRTGARQTCTSPLSTCRSFRQVAAARVQVTCDGTSSLGQVAASLRVPVIEIGSLLVNGLPAEPGHRLGAEQGRGGAAAAAAELGAVRPRHPPRYGGAPAAPRSA